jgi:hypothetical protein
VRYLVVKNRIAGDDFGYFEDTEPGRAFIEAAKPAIIGLRARAREIQTELDNRGLTPAQMMTADAERRGPLLSAGTARIRAQAYATQIDRALDSARRMLHP